MIITFPGFLDLQVNGFAGVDFNTPGCSEEQFEHACQALRATGVTHYLPTLVTGSFERFEACAQALLRYENPAMVGFHMEGPYISPLEGARGAHPVEHIRDASVEDFRRRQDVAGGRIILVTLAPEIPGAMELIEHLSETGVRVAIGHTLASDTQIADAVRAGASLSTHLGNGCPNSLHRHRNIIWDQLANDDLHASLIVDGHHLPPAVVKSVVRTKTPSRVILVTDAFSAAAAPPGRYYIGALAVDSRIGSPVECPGTSYFAGAILTLDIAVGNMVRYSGLDITEVLPMASDTPAALIGVPTPPEISGEWDPIQKRLTVHHKSPAPQSIGMISATVTAN